MCQSTWMSRDVRMNEWMDGWMGRRTNRDQAGALWGTQKKNTDHRKVDTHNVAKQIGTECRGKTREAMNQWTSGSSALCEWLCDFCRSEKKTKTKTDGTKKLPTAPAARGNTIVSGLEVVFDSIRAFIPYNFGLDRGTSFKWLHTRSYIQVLKTPLPLGRGKCGSWAKGGASCRSVVTPLQSVQRQTGPAHHHAEAQVLQQRDTSVLLKSWRWTWHRKESKAKATAFLQVERVNANNPFSRVYLSI